MGVLDDVDKTLAEGDEYMLDKKVNDLIDICKCTNENIMFALNDINNSLSTIRNIFLNPNNQRIVFQEINTDYMFTDDHAPICSRHNTPKMYVTVNSEEWEKIYYACQRLADTQGRVFSTLSRLDNLK